MKEYNVGDTIYVKGKVKQLDKDGNIYCYQVYIADVGPLWVYNSDMVEKLPTAEPVEPVLPKDVADELEIAKEYKDSFDVYIMRIINGHPTYENSRVFWSNSSDGVIKTLMDAWRYGYTVEKEKKYNVKVPHTKDVWYYKADKVYLQTICPAADKKLRGKFTESEIEHYGLQDCEKEEVKQ